MSNEQLQSLRLEAIQWARSHGFEKDADDMAQTVLERLIQNRKATVPCLCIDYLRATYGRTGKLAHKNQKTKTEEKRFYSEVNEELHGLESYTDMQTTSIDFSAFQNKLDSKDRAIFTLRYKWGFTETEIGQCFGISEGRVSQKLKEIKEKLQAMVKSDKVK